MKVSPDSSIYICRALGALPLKDQEAISGIFNNVEEGHRAGINVNLNKVKCGGSLFKVVPKLGVFTI